MAVTKTWSVLDLKRETSDNYVCEVRWKVTGTEGDKAVEAKGKTFLERPSSLEAYESLTEEKILEWVHAKMNAEAPAVQTETAVEIWEKLMDQKMAALNAPATATGKPF